MQTLYSDFSELATVASRGLTTLAGLDTGVDLTEGIDAGLELCSMLIAAVGGQAEDAARGDADAEPLVRFAVGVLTQDLPAGVVERLAAEAKGAVEVLDRLKAGKHSLGHDDIDGLCELFAQFAIVLRDYDL